MFCFAPHLGCSGKSKQDLLLGIGCLSPFKKYPQGSRAPSKSQVLVRVCSSRFVEKPLAFPWATSLFTLGHEGSLVAFVGLLPTHTPLQGFLFGWVSRLSRSCQVWLQLFLWAFSSGEARKHDGLGVNGSDLSSAWQSKNNILSIGLFSFKQKRKQNATIATLRKYRPTPCSFSTEQANNNNASSAFCKACGSHF